MLHWCILKNNVKLWSVHNEHPVFHRFRRVKLIPGVLANICHLNYWKRISCSFHFAVFGSLIFHVTTVTLVESISRATEFFSVFTKGMWMVLYKGCCFLFEVTPQFKKEWIYGGIWICLEQELEYQHCNNDSISFHQCVQHIFPITEESN